MYVGLTHLHHIKLGIISLLLSFTKHQFLISHCYQCDINSFRPHSAILTPLGSSATTSCFTMRLYTMCLNQAQGLKLDGNCLDHVPYSKSIGNDHCTTCSHALSRDASDHPNTTPTSRSHLAYLCTLERLQQFSV